MENLLTFSQSDDPIQIDCELSLRKAYPNPRERAHFEEQLKTFLSSDKDNSIVYKMVGDRLRYRTEHLIPGKKDRRVPLLLIFGNPASHSITSGMFFSPKNDGKENRFWEHLLEKAGIQGLTIERGLSTSERNEERLHRLMTGNYDSDFRVGLCVYFSMPSSAGGPWSGVAGIRRLLGKRAFDQVAKEESQRVLKEAAAFLHPNGFGVAFQKDAWNGLSSSGNYRLELAKAGELKSTFEGLPEVPLFGVPPTRLIGHSRDILRKILKMQPEKEAIGEPLVAEATSNVDRDAH